jgi:excisionase family DNA binding protein
MIIIDKKQIKDLVSEAIREAIEPHIEKMGAVPKMKPVYTVDEVCQMFGVSKRHLQHLRDTHQIGFIQNGRKILFRAEDLYDFFNNHTVKGGPNV